MRDRDRQRVSECESVCVCYLQLSMVPCILLEEQDRKSWSSLITVRVRLSCHSSFVTSGPPAAGVGARPSASTGPLGGWEPSGRLGGPLRDGGGTLRPGRWSWGREASLHRTSSPACFSFSSDTVLSWACSATTWQGGERHQTEGTKT